MGSSITSGSNRANEAVIKALDSPLLNDNKIEGSKNVLLLIVSGTEEITIDEIGEINEYIQNETGNSANIIMGVGEDLELGNNISVTVIATGFGEIQVQSVRPVHNSNYVSSVYNFNDKDFNFKYLEYQNLNFNPTQFQSNLISVLTFHVYMILGLDADTFELNGGDIHYKQARDIANYSQQGNVPGWAPPKGGDQTRRVLIDNVLSKTYQEYRTALYNYHRLGLDVMSSDTKEAKTKIANALLGFEALHKRRPNSFLVRTFFDAKSDEIADVFSAGPNVKITELVSVLNRVAPMHSKKWGTIKF